MIALFLALTAQATTGFDAANPAARFTDTHTYTLDGSAKIWSAIERLEEAHELRERLATGLSLLSVHLLVVGHGVGIQPGGRFFIIYSPRSGA